MPCSSTLGTFRDRLSNKLNINEVWLKHQEQLVSLDYTITKEHATDASFLDANPGSYGKPRGEQAKTCRSKDGTHMTKNKEHHFGFKTHAVMDLKYQLIRYFDVTTAAVHDSQVMFDFAKMFIMYADKGYVGADFSCHKGYMLRKSNDPRVNARRTQRNMRISRKRAPVERIFAVFKDHGQNFTRLTTTERNRVKILFASILYNVKQIITLQKERPKKSLEKPEEIDHEELFNLFENIPKMVENRAKIELFKKRRRRRIKNNWKKHRSMFKKPPRRTNKKKLEKSDQNTIKKKFNRKLAHFF